MTYEELKNQLTLLFSGFSFHKEFMKELLNLLQNDLSGKDSQFFKSLITQLGYIREFGRMIDQVPKHEKLKGFSHDYYSIHIKSKQFNVRLLMSFGPNEVPIFLVAFFEREGKRHTNYSRFTEVLERRLSEMMEGEQDE